ncbi:hypothetical protein [Sphingomonas mesophila]|uniref:hypothetical protein n=1 Tax=Sphingomonas mesophila TaxID=2303576 RepID=UPI000E574FA1|nr:hypothetical protein [Sphingomonas mesophila]
MTDLPIRRFASEAAIASVGERLLDCTLPRAEWTHEAHLAATAWLVARRPDIDLDRELPAIIRRYNASVGGVNDDRQGYHDTLTRAYLHGIRWFVAQVEPGPLDRVVDQLLGSDVGRRDWPLRFWSKARLFSVEARRGWVAPDLAPLPRVASSGHPC